MQTRFKKNAKIFDIVITAVGGTLSVGVMLYAVLYFGLGNTPPQTCTAAAFTMPKT